MHGDLDELYEQIDGQTSLLDSEPLSNPDANTIGKFQRPGTPAETQRQAAVAIYPTTGTKRRRVLDAFRSAGQAGATDDEIQVALDMDPSTQRPRRVELVEGGWLQDTGFRRNTRSGRSATVWCLTDAARHSTEGGTT